MSNQNSGIGSYQKSWWRTPLYKFIVKYPPGFPPLSPPQNTHQVSLKFLSPYSHPLSPQIPLKIPSPKYPTHIAQPKIPTLKYQPKIATSQQPPKIIFSRYPSLLLPSNQKTPFCSVGLGPHFKYSKIKTNVPMFKNQKPNLPTRHIIAPSTISIALKQHLTN